MRTQTIWIETDDHPALKPGDKVELRGTVCQTRADLVEITSLGDKEPRLITGEMTAGITITAIETK